MVDLPAQFHDIELVILDMDGVITSEEAYWDSAGLVVREILESPAYLGLSPPYYTPISEVFYHKLVGADHSRMRKYLPSDLIRHFKSRGINSNWDLAYLTVGLYLAPLFSSTLCTIARYSRVGKRDHGKFHSVGEQIRNEEIPSSFEIDDQKVDWLKEELSPRWDDLLSKAEHGEWTTFLRTADFHLWGAFYRKLKWSIAPVSNITLRIIDDFHPDQRGLRLLDELNTLLCREHSHRWTIFGRNTALWEDCRDLFQRWYLGQELYEKIYDQPLLYGPKPGLVHNEEPLFGREKTHRCLTKLKDAGLKLGIATGRPRMEIMTPLKEWGMTHYFEEERIVTHDEVEQAEQELKQRNIEKNIGKPHPYAFLQSIYPEKSAVELIEVESSLPDAHKILVVGDAQADIWAAQKIGCHCAAVLSGAIGNQGKRYLEEAKPDVICETIFDLTDALVALKTSGRE